ncbi:uncharacterized protein ACA1_250420 [Acanthamoeba castellanii str. Neff]|uniref:Uncharacterized protein n=1 Tax=Acanthamoeba castellanii (strain ATCC 30010 / Neff) TaxID=1257118 RepID=L8HCX3_ACACF|nr:uncharacterized protein ACA1_250420 [Acanthamoeba castellanii str. Neff]ELR22241.1 hypothetical protein ACA1_250420 [Acanthamoeba castellanii str. Neff]
MRTSLFGVKLAPARHLRKRWFHVCLRPVLSCGDAQRAHYNYLEGIALVLVTEGSRGRTGGVLIVDLALLALLSLALYGSFTFAGGLSGFFRLLGL